MRRLIIAGAILIIVSIALSFVPLQATIVKVHSVLMPHGSITINVHGCTFIGYTDTLNLPLAINPPNTTQYAVNSD
ncbi:hypothetical protein [Vulcanisaeta sp. JCM 16159]|uniref:hypothetical protein n=1 Tax=Vulcanisaeta sp. JCM 16159 TaxID=1295371 RepID=UPI0006D12AAB|nr:hypothetical protein [Vulcanisaeta sp. JCM 16159]